MEDPELWDTVVNLPDGIRSALNVGEESSNAGSDVHLQNVLPVHGMQIPLVSPDSSSTPASPFEAPRPGETLVLLAAGEVKSCYAVANGQEPRQISPAQFVAAAECQPDTPAQPLPPTTNERVMRAFEAFRAEVQQRLGRARRPRNTQARRYVSRRLNQARADLETSPDVAKRIDTLRRIFVADLPTSAENGLEDIRRLGLQGSVLLTRLEALRERFRLNPPDDSADRHPPNPKSSESSAPTA